MQLCYVPFCCHGLLNVLSCSKFINIIINNSHAYSSKWYNSNLRCCYISALMLTCFRLTKGRATFFRPETIVASFLHLMVLFSKQFSTMPLHNITRVGKRKKNNIKRTFYYFTIFIKINSVVFRLLLLMSKNGFKIL